MAKYALTIYYHVHAHYIAMAASTLDLSISFKHPNVWSKYCLHGSHIHVQWNLNSCFNYYEQEMCYDSQSIHCISSGNFPLMFFLQI